MLSPPSSGQLFLPVHLEDFHCEEKKKRESNFLRQTTMAPSSPAESVSDKSIREETSGSSDLEDNEEQQTDIKTRAPKRRRLSESEDNDDNDSDEDEDEDPEKEKVPAPAPLPTLSRIKKKDSNAQSTANNNAVGTNENPEFIRDAIEIGLQSAESSFKALKVAPWLVGSLTTMAVRKPTAIQKACIPEILSGRDCIGGSRTGSGKTIAFAVPMLQKWAQDPFGIFGLILTPTRCVFTTIDPRGRC